MFRKTTLVVAALALMMVAPQVQAAKGDWKISLLGGISAPTGSFSEKFFTTPDGLGAKLGFSGGPEFDYMVSENLAVGVDGSFTSNKLNTEERDLARLADPAFDIKYTQIGGGAHIKYWFPMSGSSFSPYVVAGAGVTNFKAEATTTLLGKVSSSKSGLGARGGLGAGYNVNEQVSIGLQGDFNYVKLDEVTFFSKSSTSFGVKAMLSFGMSSGSGQ